jgi:hypothetical protein
MTRKNVVRPPSGHDADENHEAETPLFHPVILIFFVVFCFRMDCVSLAWSGVVPAENPPQVPYPNPAVIRHNSE